MNIKTLYRYAALILGLIYGTFFLLMALDSFPFHWRSRVIGGYLIHSSPGIIVLLGAILGFKKPLFGVIIFLIVTIISILFFHSYRHLSNFMVVSFPALVVALLFLVSILNKNK